MAFVFHYALEHTDDVVFCGARGRDCNITLDPAKTNCPDCQQALDGDDDSDDEEEN